MAIAARGQPQGLARINRSNPLTRGLTIALVPSVGAVNLVSNPIKGNGALNRSVGPAGIALHDTGVTTTLTDVKAFDQPTEFSAFTLCRRTGTMANNSSSFVRNYSNNSGPSYCVFSIEYNQSGSGQNCLTAFGSTNGNNVRTPGYLIPNGGETVPHFSGLVRHATYITSYYNGVAVGNVGGISAPSYSGGNDGYVFGENSSGAMDVYLALYWQRALSDAEIASLSANPWQLFESPSQTQFPRAAAATGTTTTVTPSAGHAILTGYAPSLAQSANQSLTPAKGALTVTGYTPTMAQSANQSVIPGKGSLRLTGYQPAVSQSNSLAPGAGHILLTGHAPAISQSITLMLAPGAGHALLTGHQPTLAQSANLALTPSMAHVRFTGYAPLVANGGAVFPSPNQVALGVVYGPNGNDYVGTSTGGGGSFVRRR